MVTSHCHGLNLWFLVICHCLGDLVQVLPGLMRSCRRRSRRRRPTGRHSSRCGRTDTGRGTQGLVNAGKWLFCTIDDGNRRTQMRLKTLNNKGFQTGEDHRQEYVDHHHIVGVMHDIRQNIFSKLKPCIIVMVRLESSGDDFLFLFDLIACTCGQVVLI